MKFLNKSVIIFLIQAFLFLSVKAQEVEGGLVGETWMGGKKKAEDLYNKLAYTDAIPLYEALLKKKDDPKAQAQLGDCYRLTAQFEKAATAYDKAVASGNKDASTLLNQAQMHQTIQDYAGAKAAYEKYLNLNPNDKRAQNELNAINNLAQLNTPNMRYVIENLSINTRNFEFAPTYFGDGIYFASDRDQEKAINREHSWTGSTFYDMYFSKGEKTNMVKPDNIKKEGQTKYHDAAATFTPDGKTVFFTRNNYFDNKLLKSGEKIIKQGIYSATVDGKKWKDEKQFPFNNQEYDVAHPALSADGNTMIFSSNKPGGRGGMDLYRTTKTGESWSAPENLSELNTEGDEVFPSLDKEGNLFFSSNGLGGLGGLDLYRTTASSDYTNPVNMGAPLNSSYDDFGLTYGKETAYGYFTSNRKEGKGEDDIWYFTDNGIFLEGIVVDAITKKPICSSQVEMLADAVAKGTKTTACDGLFNYDVEANKDYCFKAKAENYLENNAVCASTKNVSPGSTVKVEIPLQPIQPAGYTVMVVDKTTKKEIKDAKVDISSDKDITKYEQKITGSDGKVCYTVLCGYQYLANASAKGYLAGSNMFDTKGDCNKYVVCEKGEAQKVIVELERDPNAKDITTDENGNPISDANLSKELKDIYYDFDKWYLRKESEPQLNKLLKFLQENPDAIVEISSHTDARATDEYNKVLSQKRAKSVVDWLIQRGINKNRLKPVGYGETKLRNECSDGVKCSEYEHQRNRRTEFKIIGGKINIESLERFDMDVDPCTICPF